MGSVIMEPYALNCVSHNLQLYQVPIPALKEACVRDTYTDELPQIRIEPTKMWNSCNESGWREDDFTFANFQVAFLSGTDLPILCKQAV